MMAYRRSLSIRATIVARRCHPNIFHILCDEDDHKHHSSNENICSPNGDGFLQRRFLGSSLDKSTASGFSRFYKERRYSNAMIFPSSGYALCRNMSTEITGGSDKIELMSDVAEAVQVVASQGAVVDEVVIAAADSFLPVKLLQYFIDAVHTYSGLNWWASIVITTLLIRSFTVPLLINQLKATSKLTLMRPRLEEIKNRMQDTGMEPMAVAEGQSQMKKLFKEFGVSPLTPLKGLFIQGPIFVSFFLAINNMAEKVPSFKSGGAYWFIDLTTPDSFYIFPILTALTFLITVECNTQEGLEGNPVAGTMKKISRVFAVLTVPLTMNFPKAVFCYWITSNLFSLTYGLVLKAPGVKKILGVPIIPVTESSAASQSAFSPFSALKLPSAVTREPTSLPVESSKHPDGKMSSSSIISHRLKSLEKQVKGRKKNKKR